MRSQVPSVCSYREFRLHRIVHALSELLRHRGNFPRHLFEFLNSLLKLNQLRPHGFLTQRRSSSTSASSTISASPSESSQSPLDSCCVSSGAVLGLRIRQQRELPPASRSSTSAERFR